MDADRFPLPPAAEKRLAALSERFSTMVYECQVLGVVDVTTVYGLIDDALRAGAEAAAEVLAPELAPKPAPAEARRPAPAEAADRLMLENQGVLPGIGVGPEDFLVGTAAVAQGGARRGFKVVEGGAPARKG